MSFPSGTVSTMAQKRIMKLSRESKELRSGTERSKNKTNVAKAAVKKPKGVKVVKKNV
jgi:hypothetical protein